MRTPRTYKRLCEYSVVGALIALFLPIITSIPVGMLPMMPFPADPWVSMTVGTISAIIMLVSSFPCFMYARLHTSIIWAAPRFIRGVASSVKSGLPLYEAIERVARTGIYGVLGKLMLRAVKRVKAGVDFEEAMRMAAREAADPVVDRLAMLLAEANAAGPKAHEVLDASSEYFTTLEEFLLLREANTRPYFAIVYLMIGVYLMIVYIVVVVLLGALASGQLPFQVNVNPRLLGVMFYWQSFVSSVAAGLFLGKVLYNNARAGFFHAAILVLIVTAFFGLTIFGPFKLPLAPANITAGTTTPSLTAPGR